MRGPARPLSSEREGWNAAALIPPPTDGTEIVILGNVTTDHGDGSYDIEPVCLRAIYLDDEWHRLIDGSPTIFRDSQTVTILHWIAAPNQHTAT